MSSDISGERSSTGRLFHTAGPLPHNVTYPVSAPVPGGSHDVVRVWQSIHLSERRTSNSWSGDQTTSDLPQDDGLLTRLSATDCHPPESEACCQRPPWRPPRPHTRVLIHAAAANHSWQSFNTRINFCKTNRLLPTRISMRKQFSVR